MKKTFGIIGYGKLGQALAGQLHGKKRLAWICSESADETKEIPDIDFYRTIQEIKTPTDIIFIAKADSFIESAATDLAEHFKEKLNKKTVIHCSGVLSVGILESCLATGAVTAKAHPFQTFYNAGEKVFENVPWAVESPGNFSEIEAIIKFLNGIAYDITKIKEFNPRLYHISAVIASNYMNTIISAAFDAAKKSGVKPEEFLPVILRTTLENNIASFEKDAEILPLTGPIARGDIKTIKLHLEALSEHKDLLEQYSRIGLATAEIAYRQDLITGDIYRIIKKLFT